MGAVTIKNFGDTFVRSTAATRNFNTAARLWLDSSTPVMQAFIYFTNPFPRGATIKSAKLRVRSGNLFSGTVTLTAQRTSAKWAASRINYNNRPGVTGATASTTKTDAAALTYWEIDITAIMQAVASGSPWYGLRLVSDSAASNWLYSSQAASVISRPEVIIEWSVPPKAPTNLKPGGGRAVSIAKPVLQWQKDASEAEELVSYQVQINGTDVWTAPAYDSGEVALSDAMHDLGPTAYAGISVGATAFWRVRHKNVSGIWSPWSNAATGVAESFTRQSKGALSITNPAANGAEIARNIIRNPSLETNTTDWSGSFGGSGSGSSTRIGPTSDAVGGQYFTRRSWTAASTTIPNNNVYTDAQGVGSVVAGDVVSGSVWARTNRLRNGRIQFQFRDAASATLTTISGPYSSMQPDVWTELKLENITAPANTDRVLIVIQPDDNAQVGDTWDSDAATLVKGPSALPHFTGDTTDTYENEYVWAGTPNASHSIRQSRPYVEETTPPFSWTFSGQRSYQLAISTPEEPEKFLWTSGKITSSDQVVEPVAGIIKETGKVYRLRVYVWDAVSREETAGDPSYVLAERDFVYQYSSSVSAVTGLTITQGSPFPFVQLDWTSGTAPDQFVILRDGVIIANVEAPEVLVSGTAYRYIDAVVGGRDQHTWEVRRIVNGQTSATSPTVSATVMNLSTWLARTDGSSPFMVVNASASIDQVDGGTVHAVLGDNPPVLIQEDLPDIYSGSVSGLIADGVVGTLTAKQMLANYNTLRSEAGTEMAMLWVNEGLRVVVFNFSKPMPIARANGSTEWLVEFDFMEVKP